MTFRERGELAAARALWGRGALRTFLPARLVINIEFLLANETRRHTHTHIYSPPGAWVRARTRAYPSPSTRFSLSLSLSFSLSLSLSRPVPRRRDNETLSEKPITTGHCDWSPVRSRRSFRTCTSYRVCTCFGQTPSKRARGRLCLFSP